MKILLQFLIITAACFGSFAQSSNPIDPRIAGVQDDGSAEGVVKSKIVEGDLTYVPWRSGWWSGNNANATVGATGGDNADGSNGYVTMSVASTTSQSQYNIRHTFRGTTYGIRFDPQFTTGGGGLYDFSVIIDGVCYRVKKAIYNFDDATVYSVQNGQHGVIVATGLPDTIHMVDVVVVNNSAGQNGNLFYGYIADSKHYPKPTRFGYWLAPTTLTASYVAITTGGTQYRRPPGIRKIFYYNADSATRTVTIQLSGATIWSKTLTVAETGEYDPGQPMTFDVVNGVLTHKADAVTTTGVTATVIPAQ